MNGRPGGRTKRQEIVRWTILVRGQVEGRQFRHREDGIITEK